MAIIFNGLPKKLRLANKTSNGLMARSDKILLQSLSTSVSQLLNNLKRTETVYIKNVNTIVAKYKNINGNILLDISSAFTVTKDKNQKLFSLGAESGIILPEKDIIIPIKYINSIVTDPSEYSHFGDALLHLKVNGDCHIIFEKELSGSMSINIHQMISYIS